ncbi:MAG TPA: hypothetical protein VM287_00045 [Egibacteraceae bacterium]|nr:hypothetical protein [Egibacteraceae bacterium]
MSARARKRRSKGSRQGSQHNGRGRGNQFKSAVGFWGDPSALPPERQDVRITEDPAAVARSLGAPPLPGYETVAEHYFAAVYDRVVTLSGALAAAAGLINPEELLDEDAG